MPIDYTTTTDYINWVNTEWNTGDWWYRRPDELREADLNVSRFNAEHYDGPFDGTYPVMISSFRTATETDEDNEDFDTTEINKYLETLREEVAVTED